MFDYSVFGGVLRSDLTLPGLGAGSGTPSWHLESAGVLQSLPGLELLGEEDVQEGVRVRLYRSSDGRRRLDFDDTGLFDISADGSRISWLRPPELLDLDLARKDVLGRVIAVALDQAGITTLHGSAVALGDAAVGFLAPKGCGKSTTATALVNAGGRLLADDILAVTPPPDCTVLPGVPVVQLWPDSQEQVLGSDAVVHSTNDETKLQIGWTDQERIAPDAVRLDSLYLLAPVEPGAFERPRRVQLDVMTAAVALLGNHKIAGLLGAKSRADGLVEACALAEVVPTYRLEIPRDLDEIPALVSQLFEWHSP